ncbi:hypothetical protein GCM10008965_16760 [Methylorubrum aminovorans]
MEAIEAASVAETITASPAVISPGVPRLTKSGVLSMRAVARPLTLFDARTTPKPVPPDPFIESVEDWAALLTVELILVVETAVTAMSPPAVAVDLTMVAVAPELVSLPNASEIVGEPISASTVLNSRFWVS